MMRSFARARSSSRRAPPKAASKPCSSIASSSVVVCRRLRDARGPVSSTTRPGVDRVLHAGHDQPLAQLGHAAVAELDDLGEVVAGVDVHEREREARRAERLLGQAQQHDRVLAAAEQQHRALELGGDLAHDVDGLGLERLQVGELAGMRSASCGRPRRGRRARRRHDGERESAPTERRARPTIVHVGTSTPALLSTPSAGAEQHAAERRAQRAGGDARQQRGADPHAGQRADQDVGHQRRGRRCRRAGAPAPAAHSRIAAWKTSVPTTRCGVRRKTRISAERRSSAPRADRGQPEDEAEDERRCRRRAALARARRADTLWRSRGDAA